MPLFTDPSPTRSRGSSTVLVLASILIGVVVLVLGVLGILFFPTTPIVATFQWSVRQVREGRRRHPLNCNTGCVAHAGVTHTQVQIAWEVLALDATRAHIVRLVSSPVDLLVALVCAALAVCLLMYATKTMIEFLQFKWNTQYEHCSTP